MLFDRLSTRLRRLYRDGAPDPKDMSQGAAALERAVMAEHAARYPPTPRGVRGFLAAHKLAFAGAAVAVAAAAACQVPVDYEREFGASVVCELARETWPEGQIDAVAGELAEALGSERLALRVHDDGGATRSFRVDLWGAEVDDVTLIAALRERVPQIPASACTRTPLAGTVHGTLGGRLGYGLLDIDLDGADAATTQREILEELARQGLEGEAEVEVRESDGHREVEIRIQARSP